MLSKTRVSGQMDVQRLSQAVSRPGIDTRIWTSLAAVTSVHVDADHGTFVDVVLMPSGDTGTAVVGEVYSGPHYGSHFPIGVDDMVIVGYPDGDQDHGLVVLSRVFSKSDPPPAEAAQNPDDVLIHVKSGQTIRVIVEGGGNFIIRDAGQSDSVPAISRVGDTVAVRLSELQSSLDARYMLNPGPIPLTSSVNGDITSGSSHARSG